MLLPFRKPQRRGNGPHTGRRPAQLRADAHPDRPRPRARASAAAAERRAAAAASSRQQSGERRAAAATESSLVQAISTGKLSNAAADSQAAAPRKRTAYLSPTSAAARSRPPRPPPPLGRGPQFDRPFIVLTETKSSYHHIPVWARYSPHRTRVEAHANTLSP
jgi:hypothetical protein